MHYFILSTLVKPDKSIMMCMVSILQGWSTFLQWTIIRHT